MAGMDDLVTWLRAQLDDDEHKIAAMQREATRVKTAPIFQSHPPDWLAGVDIFVSPTRWQVEVDAKRRLLRQFELRAEAVRGIDGVQTGGVWDDMLRLLALPYADRPGYREEWRP